MIDPTGFGPGSGIAVQVLKTAVERFLDHSEVKNLFRDLGKHYQDEPALSPTLEALKLDFEFLLVLREHFADPGVMNEQAMVNAVRSHVPDEKRTREEWAEDLAKTIIRLVPEALVRAEKSQRAQHERTRGRLDDLVGPQLFFTDWAPEGLRDALRDLSNQCPVAAGHLGRELDGVERPGPIVSELIAHPPGWVQEACAAAWDVLSRFAETYGDIPAARAALERTEGDGRVALRAARRARLAILAHLNDDPTGYARHLAAAKEANSDEPAIALALALRVRDPAERIQTLEGVSTTKELVESAIAATRAEAFLQQLNVEKARSEAARALALAPTSLRTREIHALVGFMAGLLAAEAGEPVDRVELRQAAVALEGLADQLRELGRLSEEATLLARAAVARALDEDRDRAAALLDRALSDRATLSTEAALQVADAAMAADQPTRAREALADVPETDERAQVILAAAALQVDADESAVEDLDRLTSSEDPTVRGRAARERLMASAAVGAPWSKGAAEALEGEDPVLVALVRSMVCEREEDLDGAMDALRPHLARHRVRTHAAGLLARADKVSEAIQLLEPVAAPGAPASDRLRLAYLLDQDKRYGDALGILSALRSETAVPLAARSEAYAMSFVVLGHRDDVGAQERLAREWVALGADDARAPWAHAEALARLGQFTRAVALIDERGLAPDTTHRAHLFATSLLWSDDRSAAVTRLVGLADAFGGADERLEAFVLIASLGLPPGDVEPRILERIRRGWAEFPERFPDSALLQAVQLGDNPAEAIAAHLREHPGPDPQRVEAVLGLVELGLAPVAALATVRGLGLSTTWGRLGFLPLGEPIRDLAELERQAAAGAIDAPVVVETSAVHVADGLGGEVADAIWGAFPGAVCGQSTLTDAVAGRPLPGETASRTEGTMGLDAAGELVIHAWDDEFAERETRRANGVADRVASLEVAPEADPESEHPDDLALLAEPPPSDPLVAAFGALNLARRRRLPFYCDDSFLRRRARALGIPTFGTLALIDALVARERLSSKERERARLRLIESGARGVPVDAEELVESARAANFDITPELTARIHDRAAWAAGPTDFIYRWLPLLRVAHREAPEQFEKWVLRLAVAGKRAIPVLPLNEWTAMISAAVWQPWGREEPDFVSAFLRAARGIQRWGWPDPLPGALAFLADYAEGRGGPVLRTKVLVMAAARLPIQEAVDVIFGEAGSTAVPVGAGLSGAPAGDSPRGASVPVATGRSGTKAPKALEPAKRKKRRKRKT